ncbi:triphosphoribosyl-dephospho-CoA synthase [Paraburkholderia sacchari]|uniref:Triphosphoribosyl-dephospho-CoA synthase n=1 Tax=Paraburkholderia sacchari TaxID=159450 RepID=A0A8T6ZDA8_9BURK|nr:triphosphoribosyl-dephospho-CoA synthase [Paraburkholderia sacchari]NLP62766.1 triphosphoribosyl-dephospho-CoA synthase [Paraburkholderia sacchari]
MPTATTATTATTAAAIKAAFLWACEQDVVCAKPGNVSIASAGHGMNAEHFLASARAACAPLTRDGASVGARIEAAIAGTRAVAGCNTNLGIVLLCAPLAAAFERAFERAFEDAFEADPPSASLSACAASLQQVLHALSVEDACAAYRAIALANPGGLGEADSQSVGTTPTVDLRAAMTLAADRDSIARQYAEDFRDVLGFGLATFRAACAARAASPTPLADAVLLTWFGFLARWPDSHIARKHGNACAQRISDEAAAWLAQGEARLCAPGALDNWDAALKAGGINPGTSADLTVATLFAAACLDTALVAHTPIFSLD